MQSILTFNEPAANQRPGPGLDVNLVGAVPALSGTTGCGHCLAILL
jgi:hypothetical protein